VSSRFTRSWPPVVVGYYPEYWMRAHIRQTSTPATAWSFVLRVWNVSVGFSSKLPLKIYVEYQAERWVSTKKIEISKII